MNRWYPLGQLVLARIREFFREPEAIFWVYFFPLLLAVALGLAFSSRAPEPPIVDVEKSSDTEAVQKIVETLKAAKCQVQTCDQDDCAERLRTGKSSLTVAIGQDTKDNKPAFVYRFDPTRSDSFLARQWVDAILVRADPSAMAVPKADDKVVTERGSTYIDFLYPGLIGMNLMGGGLFGVGFVLVDMRVRKLFKRLLATPMRRTDFLLALLLSRLVFLIPEMSMLLLVATLVFGVPIRGNPLTLAVVILAGVATFDGLGLLIACRTEKTETASGLMQACMLPMYLLSGTFFSSSRFPEAVQPLIQALPLTQTNDALREVMLEGKGLTDVAWRIGIMLIWAVVCSALALKWFRWR